MNWIVVLLFVIGFVDHKACGSNEDPAPGRSPGPPLTSPFDFYSSDASHEAYRPVEAPKHILQQQSSSVYNSNSNDVEQAVEVNDRNKANNRFSDIFSSMSREYRDNDNDDDDDNNDNDDDDSINSNRHKLLIDNKPTDMTVERLNDELALNALKDSTINTMTLPSITATRLDTDSLVNINSSGTNSISGNDNSIKMMRMVDGAKHNRKSRCNSGLAGGKIFNYIRLGDKVVKVNFNNAKSESHGPGAGKFQIDVIHDVFSTTTSLLAGIIYKGKRKKALFSYIHT